MTNIRARVQGPGGTQLLWLLAVAAGCLLTWAACAGVGSPSYRTCAAAAAVAAQPATAGSASAGVATPDTPDTPAGQPASACGPAS
ncbi:MULTISPECIES: hypothetical protein [Pseudofrankia]|uniref:hypothetical protein n=1 Tax=Pseudofrankia TaxID=2994363 RepID=UPI000234C301|nr:MULTISPECIES: hypothetical protein [Pseudofrankia]OHV37098.1 hypothetical protein BCD49_18085 [Pseudofrankia sp. EUN1h]